MKNLTGKNDRQGVISEGLLAVAICLLLSYLLLGCKGEAPVLHSLNAELVLRCDTTSQLPLSDRILVEYVKLGRDDDPFTKFPAFPGAVASHETAELTSRLYKETNNMYGIKCFNPSHKKKGYRGSHCVQYYDDEPSDRFIKFKTRWEAYKSFRALARTKYKDCFRKDSITECLDCYSRIGYATSSTWPRNVKLRYDQLSKLTENLSLYEN